MLAGTGGWWDLVLIHFSVHVAADTFHVLAEASKQIYYNTASRKPGNHDNTITESLMALTIRQTLATL